MSAYKTAVCEVRRGRPRFATNMITSYISLVHVLLIILIYALLLQIVVGVVQTDRDKKKSFDFFISTNFECTLYLFGGSNLSLIRVSINVGISRRQIGTTW